MQCLPLTLYLSLFKAGLWLVCLWSAQWAVKKNPQNPGESARVSSFGDAEMWLETPGPSQP